jgi:hypothetical protein
MSFLDEAWNKAKDGAFNLIGGATNFVTDLLSGGGSSQPDTSGLNAAAVTNSQVAADTLAWYKEKDARDRPMQQKLADKAYEVADQQLASSRTNDALAADYAAYNKNTFRPLEQGIVADAQGYDTPEKRQAAADSAIADTNMAFSKTNDATARALAANGINPGSTRAMSVMQGQAVDQAEANAGAAFKARKGVESVGHAMKMDAASLGRGLASSQATAAQTAIQAGNSSVGNAGAPITAANQNAATYGNGMNAVVNANNSAGNLYGQQANIWNTAKNNQNNYELGMVNAATNAYKASDENLKTDIEPVDPDESLEEIVKTPVSKWKYDPSKIAAKGIDVPPEDMGENEGPMAQQVQKTMGDEVAPGGKEINLISMNGKSMAAIQALDRKVTKLAKMIQSGQVKAGEKA